MAEKSKGKSKTAGMPFQCAMGKRWMDDSRPYGPMMGAKGTTKVKNPKKGKSK